MMSILQMWLDSLSVMILRIVHYIKIWSFCKLPLKTIKIKINCIYTVNHFTYIKTISTIGRWQCRNVLGYQWCLTKCFILHVWEQYESTRSIWKRCGLTALNFRKSFVKRYSRAPLHHILSNRLESIIYLSDTILVKRSSCASCAHTSCGFRFRF